MINEKFNFPCGEMNVHVMLEDREKARDYADIKFEFTGNESIVELLLKCDAIQRMGKYLRVLEMPYVPFSRQDRVMIEGESLSIKVFADLINNLGFETVIITDPHSDVTPALIDNCKVIAQDEVFYPYLYDKKDFILISPDAGALKKINKLAKRTNPLYVIECSKYRDIKTGEITGTKVHANDLMKKDCYIVDDICDGGRTFIEIAKELKLLNCGKIILMVTHGFFTKGLEVFDGIIDEIYTMKGKVK